MFWRKNALPLSAIFLLTLVWGCSSDDTGTGEDERPEPVTESIGPEGGTIGISGEVSLIIPDGVLADTVDFSIVRNTSPSPGGDKAFASSVFTIEPSATNFSSPCSLTIEYNEAQLGAMPDDSVKVCIHNGTVWEALTTTVNKTNNTATATISHLSDYADMYTPPAQVSFSDIADFTEKGLRLFFEFFDGVHYVMQFHQYEIGSLPEGVRYYRAGGKYEFDINVTGEVGDDSPVTGYIIPNDTAYYWRWVCTEWDGDVCADSEYVATDTIPPTYIEDGFQENEVARFAWSAKRYLPNIHTVGAGTFALRMLDYTRYHFTLVDRTVFLPYDDLGIFEITSLGYSWDWEAHFTDSTRFDYIYHIRYFRCVDWDTLPDPDVCRFWFEVTSWPYDRS